MKALVKASRHCVHNFMVMIALSLTIMFPFKLEAHNDIWLTSQGLTEGGELAKQLDPSPLMLASSFAPETQPSEQAFNADKGRLNLRLGPDSRSSSQKVPTSETRNPSRPAGWIDHQKLVSGRQPLNTVAESDCSWGASLQLWPYESGSKRQNIDLLGNSGPTSFASPSIISDAASEIHPAAHSSSEDAFLALTADTGSTPPGLQQTKITASTNQGDSLTAEKGAVVGSASIMCSDSAKAQAKNVQRGHARARILKRPVGQPCPSDLAFQVGCMAPAYQAGHPASTYQAQKIQSNQVVDLTGGTTKSTFSDSKRIGDDWSNQRQRSRGLLPQYADHQCFKTACDSEAPNPVPWKQTTRSPIQMFECDSIGAPAHIFQGHPVRPINSHERYVGRDGESMPTSLSTQGQANQPINLGRDVSKRALLHQKAVELHQFSQANHAQTLQAQYINHHFPSGAHSLPENGAASKKQKTSMPIQKANLNPTGTLAIKSQRESGRPRNLPSFSSKDSPSWPTPHALKVQTQQAVNSNRVAFKKALLDQAHIKEVGMSNRKYEQKATAQYDSVQFPSGAYDLQAHDPWMNKSSEPFMNIPEDLDLYSKGYGKSNCLPSNQRKYHEIDVNDKQVSRRLKIRLHPQELMVPARFDNKNTERYFEKKHRELYKVLVFHYRDVEPERKIKRDYQIKSELYRIGYYHGYETLKQFKLDENLDFFNERHIKETQQNSETINMKEIIPGDKLSWSDLMKDTVPVIIYDISRICIAFPQLLERNGETLENLQDHAIKFYRRFWEEIGSFLFGIINLKELENDSKMSPNEIIQLLQLVGDQIHLRGPETNFQISRHLLSLWLSFKFPDLYMKVKESTNGKVAGLFRGVLNNFYLIY